jgi:hypothetical protein
LTGVKVVKVERTDTEVGGGVSEEKEGEEEEEEEEERKEHVGRLGGRVGDD